MVSMVILLFLVYVHNPVIAPSADTVKVHVLSVVEATSTTPAAVTPHLRPVTSPAVNVAPKLPPFEQSPPVSPVTVPGSLISVESSSKALVAHSLAKPAIVPIAEPASAFFCALTKAGSAAADKTPRMLTTVNSSINVNPFSSLLLFE